MLLKTLYVFNRKQSLLVGRLRLLQQPTKGLSSHHPIIKKNKLPQFTNDILVIKNCKFHTTRALNVPPYLALLIRPLTRVAALVFGRLFKRWWARKSPEEKEAYKKWFSARRRKIYGVSGFALASLMLYYFCNMEKDPLTGRSRFIILNKEQQKVLSDLSLNVHMEMHGAAVVPPTHPAYKRLIKIVERLVKANQDLPSVAERDWTLTIVDSEDTNAYVLPGGNIFVFLGILNLVENDDQLAFVLAHEISHVLLQHSIESISRNFLLDILLAVPIALIWAMAPDLLALVLQGLGVGLTNIIITLPYSRTLEREADDIGLRLASKACVDVREAVVFWAMMRQLTQMKGNPEESAPTWLSTHPAHEDREKYLSDKLPEALELRSKCGCWGLGRKDPVINFRARSHKDHLKRFTEKGLLS